MAARKLQQEIDKTLKKVAEGVEVFDGIWEKVGLGRQGLVSGSDPGTGTFMRGLAPRRGLGGLG